MVFDPVKQRKVQMMQPGTFTTDMHLNYEVEPMYTSLGVPPGTYWLMVDTPSATASLSRTDYDLSIQFRGMPSQRQVHGRDRRHADGDGDAHHDGRHDLRRQRHGAVRHLRLVGLLSGDAQLPPARRQGHRLQRRRAGAEAPHRHVDAERESVAPGDLDRHELQRGAEISCVAASAVDDVHRTRRPSPGRTSRRAIETVFIIVDSEQDAGAFSLATSFTDGPAAPANDTCAGAIALDLTSGLASVEQRTTEGASDD